MCTTEALFLNLKHYSVFVLRITFRQYDIKVLWEKLRQLLILLSYKTNRALKNSGRMWVSLIQEVFPKFNHLASFWEKLYIITNIFSLNFWRRKWKMKPTAQRLWYIFPPQHQAKPSYELFYFNRCFSWSCRSDDCSTFF